MIKLRLFTALVPESELIKGIIALQKTCRRSGMENLRYIEAENLHVTVNFLGDTSPQDLSVLHEILTGGVSVLKSPAFRPHALGLFPSPRRARSINLLLEDPEGSMDAMFRHLDGTLRGAGFPGERRSFRPHISFGRFRSRRGELMEEDSLPSLTAGIRRIFRCSELVLFRSDLGPGGARYYPEGRYRFGNQTNLGD
ncbi:RNA 2',3'-cyclic phosphodiesterase [Marispirochaeta aestuarii]|uniref:RNA 2',3'-cyclic phosphodiesterase n=1 Tax=Marispirochaeta aestuarii TaxID=1963862 RepID=UPI0029C90F94|nr:RNA 2',3'-cyclic phosphodiesterase [Marispirochaeta aestuarii]